MIAPWLPPPSSPIPHHAPDVTLDRAWGQLVEQSDGALVVRDRQQPDIMDMGSAPPREGGTPDVEATFGADPIRTSSR